MFSYWMNISLNWIQPISNCSNISKLNFRPSELKNLLNWITEIYCEFNIHWIESQQLILNWIIFWIEFSWNDFESNIEFNQLWAKFKHCIDSIWVSNRAIASAKFCKANIVQSTTLFIVLHYAKCNIVQSATLFIVLHYAKCIDMQSEKLCKVLNYAKWWIMQCAPLCRVQIS